MSVSRNLVATTPKNHNGSSHVEVSAAEVEVVPEAGDIAELAYQRFLARGSVHGFHEEDWVSAERELKNRA